MDEEEGSSSFDVEGFRWNRVGDEYVWSAPNRTNLIKDVVKQICQIWGELIPARYAGTLPWENVEFGLGFPFILNTVCKRIDKIHVDSR